MSGSEARSPDRVAALTIVLVGAVLGALRLGLLDVPLERDEGDYAVHAQLLLQGVPPYTEAYEMRLPGIFAAYAAILALFGESREGIRLGLLIVNLTTAGIVFGLGRRFFGPAGGIGAAAVFGAATLCPGMFGFTANTEHFVLMPAIAGLGLLADGRRGTARVLASGALLGVAVLMKQHGVFFAALAAWWVVRPAEREGAAGAIGSLVRFAAGFALPVAVAIGWIAASGAFERFWFWTVVVPADYVTSATAASAWNGLALSLPDALRSVWLSWSLAAAGLVALLASERARAGRRFVVGLALASLAAVCVGFTFRGHGWLFIAPLLALLAGAAVAGFGGWLESLAGSGRHGLVRAMSLGLAVLPLVQLVANEREFLFRMSGTAIARERYDLNPFPESIEVARYIRERTGPDERVAVFGSEPQIYFYAQRRSASPYILGYPLMEPHPYAREMQEEMAAAIEAAAPRYLVYVGVPTSWLLRPDSERWIADWMAKYTAGSYRRVGVVDIRRDGTRYFWDEDAAGVMPESDHWLSVFERIPGR
jgi:hypothetical protein